jgi:hypothetical protein
MLKRSLMPPSSGREVLKLEGMQQHMPPKHWQIFTSCHKVTSQKTSIFIVSMLSAMICIQTMQYYGKISNLDSSYERLTLVLISSNWYLHKSVARIVKGT